MLYSCTRMATVGMNYHFMHKCPYAWFLYWSKML